jgi:hypothetical protein
MSEQGRQRRCVFVVGPESSGSRLAAKIVAHVLGVHAYGHWATPVGWSHSDLPQGHVSDSAHNIAVAAGTDTVCHRSLPYGRKGDTYPDLERWCSMNRDALTQFVITTRDVSIVDRSKRIRFNRTEALCQMNRQRSRQWIADVVQRKLPCFIWSYETLVYLREDYLRQLYAFLGVESDFVPPDLFDGNEKYVSGGSVGPTG